jgi:hypothetical protein
MKGREGFPHPYLQSELATTDPPEWEGGLDETRSQKYSEQPVDQENHLN